MFGTWEKEDNCILEKDATPNGACMIFPAKGKYSNLTFSLILN
jgi:hypothetical protein